MKVLTIGNLPRLLVVVFFAAFLASCSSSNTQSGGTFDPASDSDGDGDVDFADGDYDGNGTVNALDLDFNGDGVADVNNGDDANNDGFLDFNDFDINGDNVNDSSDDFNNDGIVNIVDAQVRDSDLDGDGDVDFADGDYDANGIVENADFDLNGDGVISSLDDRNNDGFNDSNDFDFNGDGVVDSRDDINSDGLLNSADVGANASPCNGASGTDPNSSNDDWGDNCTLSTGVAHKDSSYTRGVQRILWCQLYAPVGLSEDMFTDGSYGPNTKAAVEAFQSNNGLDVDGVVGPETWTALQGELTRIETGIEYDTWGVRNTTDCEGQAMFYQRLNANLEGESWEMAQSRGSDTRVVFSTGF